MPRGSGAICTGGSDRDWGPGNMAGRRTAAMAPWECSVEHVGGGGLPVHEYWELAACGGGEWDADGNGRGEQLDGRW